MLRLTLSQSSVHILLLIITWTQVILSKVLNRPKNYSRKDPTSRDGGGGGGGGGGGECVVDI